MHTPAQFVAAVDASGADPWLKVLVILGSVFSAFFLLGIVIGVLFRNRQTMYLPVGMAASLLGYALLEWAVGGPDEWSWRHPIASLLYQGGPIVFTCIMPMFFGIGFGRRHAISTRASNKSLEPTADRRLN
jgi:hypothetical protein